MPASYYRHGAGRSLNARAAESDGRQPLTRAVVTVARAARVTRKQARAVLLALHAGEWHHVGKYAAECEYHDTAEAIAYLRSVSEELITEARAAMVAELAASSQIERRTAAVLQLRETLSPDEIQVVLAILRDHAIWPEIVALARRHGVFPDDLLHHLGVYWNGRNYYLLPQIGER